MSATEDGGNYAISTALLAAQADLAWANLGDWQDTGDYVAACRQLARRHGDAIALGPDDRLLDLACGQGASLLFWPDAFGTREVTAVDIQAACVARIRAQAPAALQAIHHARFDRLPLPEGLAGASCDAAICVDAAYHASSLSAFAGFAAAAVKPGGRLAFSTLLQAPAMTVMPAWRQGMATALLASAGIPAASLVSAETLRTTLAATGWQNTVITPLPQVLGGFADFVAARAQGLPLRQRLSPGWLKIAMTGRLCRQLHDNGHLRYVLVSATRD